MPALESLLFTWLYPHVHILLKRTGYAYIGYLCAFMFPATSVISVIFVCVLQDLFKRCVCIISVCLLTAQTTSNPSAYRGIHRINYALQIDRLTPQCKHVIITEA